MKKNILILFFSAFLANVLFGAIVITDSNVSKSDFDTAFNSEAVWHTQFQAGGTSGFDSHELEINDGEQLFTDNITWNNSGNNNFSIFVDASNNLGVSVNGNLFSPADSQVLNPFNEIWIGASMRDLWDDQKITITHQYDNIALEPITLNNSSGTIVWYSFKFTEDPAINNIGEFTIDGILDIDIGGAGGEDWTYTVMGIYNPAIPEPSSYAFTAGFITLLFLLYRKNRNRR